MSDLLEPIQYETGTSIQTFNIIETKVSADGYEVLLNIDLDSGYELENVKMKITFEELEGYETDDIQEGVKYALGFFTNHRAEPFTQSQPEESSMENNLINNYNKAWGDDRL